MVINKDALNGLLAGADGKDVLGKNGLFDEVKKALAGRMLKAQMDHPLTQEAVEPYGNDANHRNGYSNKTVLTDAAKTEIAVPGDRAGTFDPSPNISIRREDRVDGCARHECARDPWPSAGADLIGTITDAVGEWQNRPLEPVYANVFFACLRVKIRGEGTVHNKAICPWRSAGWNQVLVARHERAEKPRRQRHSDRRR